MTESLFPPDLFEFPNKWELSRTSPLDALKTAGDQLIQKSKDLLKYEIKRQVKDCIYLDFMIVVPALDDYAQKLFTVSYSVESLGYPTTLISWKNEKVTTDIDSWQVLMSTLREFFHRKETQQIVGCLYYHAQYALDLNG